MDSLNRLLGWNDRRRWVQARLAGIGLGVFLVWLSFALPPIVYPCDNYLEACHAEELGVWIFIPGLLTVFSAFALWVSGRDAAILGVVQGLVLLCLGLYWSVGIGLNDDLSMTAVPANTMWVCGFLMMLWGAGVLLVRGIAKLTARVR